MVRDISFDSVAVEWVTFRPDPSSPGRALLTAYGSLRSQDGIEIPRSIDGWGAVSDATRTALEAALRAALYEVAADELTLTDGDGLVPEPGGTLRQAGPGETPAWVKGG